MQDSAGSGRTGVLDDGPFIANVESLIDPMQIGDLLFFQGFKRLMPRWLFKRLLARTARKTPYMGFVIEPYCLFLFFKLKDIERARAMLPERFELVPSAIFAGDEPAHYLGMGIFNTRASAFFGTRLESYLIARDRQTGLISWIFIDILSNTLISLPAAGIADPNCQRCVFTTTSKGEIVLDIEEAASGRRLALKARLEGGRMRGLDQPLWINGNNSIGFSRELGGQGLAPFAVIFDPAEVEKAIDLPTSSIELLHNDLFPGLADSTPCQAVCFPFAQHYIADSPGCRTYVADEAEMVRIYDQIAGMRGMRTFSARTIKRLFLTGTALSALACGVLLAFLII